MAVFQRGGGWRDAGCLKPQRLSAGMLPVAGGDQRGLYLGRVAHRAALILRIRADQLVGVLVDLLQFEDHLALW